MKVMTPEDELMLKEEASVPLKEYVILSPSSSLAVTVPTDVWFSAALKVAEELITGSLSLTLVTLMVKAWVSVLVPSLALTVMEYEVLVS